MSVEPKRRVLRVLRWGAWGIGALVLVLLVAGSAFFLSLRLDARSRLAEVPDLVGLPRDDAARRAEDRGLLVEVIDRRHDPQVQSGSVLLQDPAAGVVVRPGRTIRLVLSLGGEVIPVPGVVGHASRRVEIELRQQGLTPGEEAHVYDIRAPLGTVLAQVPPPGTAGMPGTRVHRLVSDGPRPPRWVMPDLAGRPLAVAERWIETAGFRKGAVRRVPSPGTPAGGVVGQLPLAGYPIGARDVVELTVAE